MIGVVLLTCDDLINNYRQASQVDGTANENASVIQGETLAVREGSWVKTGISITIYPSTASTCFRPFQLETKFPHNRQRVECYEPYLNQFSTIFRRDPAALQVPIASHFLYRVTDSSAPKVYTVLPTR
ncbi:hypothetical protein M378DRAFT_530390 [Amanita muscaria Koide BX008]|uniref:Uncharacterized protein n=1 Tax=Amanita muscaria (strain Koide BX008) TaxID=946122 RepID=A0A0C2X889_AMAMK|nr:hypothetical protein M378DRAFT_530390 [Amanita muscaria Koide BX008]